MVRKFRFQDLEIWQMAIVITDKLFDIADTTEEKRLYRFTEQLRGAAMSISNNIAEGSGSDSKNDFARFVNFARRSAFECANILIILYRRKLISEQVLDDLFTELEKLSRKMTNFKKSLRA
ncbi:MAG: four helix bundle protein [bacterium]